MIQPHHSFPITHGSQVYQVKRKAGSLAHKFGLDEVRTGKVNLIVAEMVTNLINHKATEGEILIKPIGHEHEVVGMEILSLDKGPGMKDAKRMVEDGVSSMASAGHGLGSIKRLSHEFDIYSSPGAGTFILARVYRKEGLIPGNRAYALDALMVCKPGYLDCGDGWSWKGENNRCSILAMDGLGHGQKAQEAAQHSIEAFNHNSIIMPSEMIRAIHQNIKKTRGAVGAVINIDFSGSKLTFSGVGNIAGKVLSGDDFQHLVFHSGILGNNIPNRIVDRELAYEGAMLLVLHSDGLLSRWNLKKFPRIRKHHPVIIAAALYKWYTRGNDDVLIIICKN